MSLKSFHIFFIAASALLALGSAWYALVEGQGAGRFAWAILALAFGVLLAVYGRRFLRKMNDLEAGA